MSFTIAPKALTTVAIGDIADVTYTGSAAIPTATVTADGATLASGDQPVIMVAYGSNNLTGGETGDYTVTYGANTDAGDKVGTIPRAHLLSRLKPCIFTLPMAARHTAILILPTTSHSQSRMTLAMKSVPVLYHGLQTLLPTIQEPKVRTPEHTKSPARLQQ